jgi:hypothetical protein
LDSTIAEALLPLVGTWEGAGRGEYPTLDPFDYRELLEVDGSPESPFLHYRQQTWRDQDGGEVGSHVETGFISLDENQGVNVLNAEGSDRVEVLTGTMAERDGVLVLDLRSVVLAHDERMISSWRQIEVEGDELRYTMGMATTRVPEGANHLTARLTRR